MSSLTILEAEYACLGSMIHMPVFVPNVGEWLEVKDFSSPLCREVYELLLDLDRQGYPIDPVTVLAACRARGVAGPSRQAAVELTDMLQAAVNPVLCETYARVVLDSAIRRKVVEVGTRLVQLGETPTRLPMDVLDMAREQYAVLHEQRLRWRQAREGSLLRRRSDSPQRAADGRGESKGATVTTLTARPGATREASAPQVRDR